MQRTTRASHSDWVVLPCVWGSCARGLGIFCGRARSNGSGERSHKTHMQSTSDPHKHTGVYRQASRTHGRTCLASPGPVKPTSERGGVSDNPTDRPREGGRAVSQQQRRNTPLAQQQQQRAAAMVAPMRIIPALGGLLLLAVAAAAGCVVYVGVGCGMWSAFVVRREGVGVCGGTHTPTHTPPACPNRLTD